MQKVNGQIPKIYNILCVFILLITVLSLFSCQKEERFCLQDKVFSQTFQGFYRDKIYEVNSLEKIIYEDYIYDSRESYTAQYYLYLIDFTYDDGNRMELIFFIRYKNFVDSWNVNDIDVRKEYYPHRYEVYINALES